MITDIGLVPYRESASQSLPNKPFHYASAGIPVLSSLHGEFDLLREKYNIGEFYIPGDSHSFCHTLIRMIADPGLKQQGENARNLFKEKFDANKIYNEYSNHLENIVSSYSISNGSGSSPGLRSVLEA